MTAAEIRQSFLNFFRDKQHTIVPSVSLLPQSPGLLFTNAGMNPFVPYFLGVETAPYAPPRAADTQKCIRAGGKHNDLEDVGYDTYHHTFFEMLGNWSFGNYFKNEAITWAWELVVERWGMPASRLYASVYAPKPGDPGEFDQESWDLWANLFRAKGCDPAIHIVNGSVKDNFWMMGETGPCGPCSELHVDLTPDGRSQGQLVNHDSDLCIEIWNLVFIQYNAEADGSFRELPAKHVDTGMGFERACSIIQGTKGFTDFSSKPSNYATDVFQPLFRKLEALCGKCYVNIYPAPGAERALFADELKTAIAFRVIADHLRTLAFSIADGIMPGNTGRNYVLRRILRRAVRYGRQLGFSGDKPFFGALVATLVAQMGGVFPELMARQDAIRQTLEQEEASFNQTLDRGLKRFEEAVGTAAAGNVGNLPESQEKSAAGALPKNTSAARSLPSHGQDAHDSRRDASTHHQLSGDLAFELYDTFGFPVDLTELLCAERGLKVDMLRFEKLMEQQRERARAAQKSTIVRALDIATEASTEFLGFELDEVEATVLEVHPQEDAIFVITDKTVFYAEMGGQAGDTGTLTVAATGHSEMERQAGNPLDRSISKRQTLPITGTQQIGKARAHIISRSEISDLGSQIVTGAKVVLRLDAARRRPIEAHHSATHLLHWALHEVVSKDAAQQGSAVDENRLRFDFNSGAVTPAQIAVMEEMVNAAIKAADAVSWTEVKHASIKGRADIMQFFGDKYGDTVRVVQIGGEPDKLSGYSMELCGGTHVRNTGAIGLFKIKSEGAIASGVRRIEAVCGDVAWAHLNELVEKWNHDLKAATAKLHVANERLAVLGEAPVTVNEFPHIMGAMLVERADISQLNAIFAHGQRTLEETRDAAIEAEKRIRKIQASQAARLADEALADLIAKGEPIIASFEAEASLLQELQHGLKKKNFAGPALLIVDDGDKLHLATHCGATALIAGLKAGDLLRDLAAIAGGKGGGKPDQARGAAPQREKLAALIAAAVESFNA
ncbi:MAG: alanine--tRNA ligase [Verrucomicrobia bacterium]|nr:alanine--tRNA ligase [Verrucomicrobiota bacterium]